ncbi:MAG: RelA/SpoT domain-containing protein [Candidatus Dadabacteria bacterium]|nr:RelA/SpoT domain-containing protein [Candidatus Dadabacteria bacterium]
MYADCPYRASEEEKFKSRGEVDRATEKYRKNPKDPVVHDVLNAYRSFRLNCIRTSLSLLRESTPPDRVLISARLKRLQSILRKIRCGYKGSISEMDDIIGFRVVCESYRAAVSFGERIRQQLPNSKVKDYLQEEHSIGIGYRAIHGIVKFDQPFRDKKFSVRFEIQVRSWYQHMWACWCESFGEQAKKGFRNVEEYDGKTLERIERLKQISKQIAEWEISNPDKIQEDIPTLSDPHNAAVAWFNSQGEHGFQSHRSDIFAAAQDLEYLEAKSDIEPLLLVGVTDAQDLKKLLLKTHPRFARRGFPDPEYWMPE